MKKYKKYIILLLVLGLVTVVYLSYKYKCSSNITTIQELRSYSGNYVADQNIEIRKCGSKRISNTIVKVTDDKSRTQNVYTAYGVAFDQTAYKNIPFLLWKKINSQESLVICQPEKALNTPKEISFPPNTNVPVAIESPDSGPWVNCFEYDSNRERLGEVETTSAGINWPEGWIRWQAVYEGELVTMIGPSKSLDNFIIVLHKSTKEKYFPTNIKCKVKEDMATCVIGDDPAIENAFDNWKLNN